MTLLPIIDKILFGPPSGMILTGVKEPLCDPIGISTPNGLVYEELYENLRHL